MFDAITFMSTLQAKVAYYACYLILSGIDAPIFNKAAIEDSIHEVCVDESLFD